MDALGSFRNSQTLDAMLLSGGVEFKGGYLLIEISRRSFILGSALALLSYSLLEVNFLLVKKYTILVKGLSPAFDGFTILHLSDLHNKEFGHKQEKLLNLINKQEFHLVAITGDLVDKRNPRVMPGIHLVEKLSHKPVYFVPGNHDWWNGFKFREQLIESGVKILENQAEKFSLNGEHFWVVGVDDPYLGRDNLGQALLNVNDAAPKILLAHAPNIYDAAIKSGIDLVMVGHTHGGQVRLPILGAIVIPGQDLFPKLDYGLFTSGKTSMIINGGLGESVLPIRFNMKPEIVLLTLRTDQ